MLILLQEDDFDEDEGIYDELNLDEEEEKFGLLADEFTEQGIKIWELHKYEQEEGSEIRDGSGVYGWTWFNKEKGIKIPLKPFAGEMGVAPGKAGAHSTIPPYATGGNIDTRHITAGSTLYLPIQAEGALFSIGVREPSLWRREYKTDESYCVGWSCSPRRWRGLRYRCCSIVFASLHLMLHSQEPPSRRQ